MNTYTGDSDLLRSMAAYLPPLTAIMQETVSEPSRLRITCMTVPHASEGAFPGVYPPSRITIQYDRMNPEPEWMRDFIEREYAAASMRPIGMLYTPSAMTLRLKTPMKAEESNGVVILDGEWELSLSEAEADAPLIVT